MPGFFPVSVPGKHPLEKKTPDPKPIPNFTLTFYCFFSLWLGFRVLGTPLPPRNPKPNPNPTSDL